MKKGQVTMEFSVMLGISMIVVFGFVFIFGEVYESVNHDKKIKVFDDFAKSIQIEIITASHMSSGFNRNLILPQKIESFEYQIDTLSNTLIINYDGGLTTLIIPNTLGKFTIGQNTLSNNNGTVCINC